MSKTVNSVAHGFFVRVSEEQKRMELLDLTRFGG